MATLPQLLPGSDTTDSQLLDRAFKLKAEKDEIQSAKEFLSAFLAQSTSSGSAKLSHNTLLSYEKELLRLLLFLKERSLPLNEVQYKDVIAYRDWVSDPPAHLISNAGKRTRRSHPDWKPFAGRPGPSTVSQSIKIIKSLYSWLMKVGVVTSNPWAAIGDDRAQQVNKKRKHNDAKTLTPEDITVVKAYLDAMASLGSSKQQKTIARYRWVFFAYLWVGLRASELVDANSSMLRQQRIQGQNIWELRFTGKGGKDADLPLPDLFMEEMKRYRIAIGKSPLPDPKDAEPFIFSLNGTNPVTTRQSIFLLYKALMKKVSNSPYCDSLDQALRLEGSSPHSLRHTFVTEMLDLSNDTPAIQELSRHSDIRTTMGYDKSRQIHLVKLMNDLSHKINEL